MAKKKNENKKKEEQQSDLKKEEQQSDLRKQLLIHAKNAGYEAIEEKDDAVLQAGILDHIARMEHDDWKVMSLETKQWSNAIFAAEKKKKEAAAAAAVPPAEKKKVAEAKKEAKEKAAVVSESKAKLYSPTPYKKDTFNWHVSQCIKAAGKSGITAEEVLKAFKVRVKKYKLSVKDPEKTVKSILKQCITFKALATLKDDRYFATKKLIEVE